jgi:hypothetical protein
MPDLVLSQDGGGDDNFEDEEQSHHQVLVELKVEFWSPYRDREILHSNKYSCDFYLHTENMLLSIYETMYI